MAYKNREDERAYNKKYYQRNKEEILKRKKRWLENNPERERETRKKYYKNNSGKIKKYCKQWRKNNLEKIREYDKQWRKNNSEKRREISNRYQKNNPGKNKERAEQWAKNNPEKVRERKRKWDKDKRKIDLKYNINEKMSCGIRASIKGNEKRRSWEKLVGYTLIDLIKRLKNTMPAGYTWQDYLQGKLHIDHIIPIDAFNFTRLEHTDFKRCWELENLQLLPARENLIKHTKLSKPFQPALRI